LVSAQRLWHVEASGATADPKRHAGASSTIQRTPLRPFYAEPPGVRTNLSIPALPLGQRTLYLLPDHVLIFRGSTVGAVGYDQLQCAATALRFIEEQAVPSDAAVVGSSWKYVNKDGGPDRRFANNRELPIVEYGQLRLSAAGLNELIEASNPQAPARFAAGLEALRRGPTSA
jgi:hypothetical protein